MADELEKLRQLVRVGRDPRQRTLSNFAKIVREMERLDPKARPQDILSAFVHLSFYWRTKGITSVLEDNTWVPFFLKYPKDNSGKLIQDQLKINSHLKKAFEELYQEIKDNWLLIKLPGSNELANFSHSLSALDCGIRSGKFSSWLYSFGGDILKIPGAIWDKIFGPKKTQEELRKEKGSLSSDDWHGDQLGYKIITTWDYEVLFNWWTKGDKKMPKLSDVLEETDKIFANFFKHPAQQPQKFPKLNKYKAPLPKSKDFGKKIAPQGNLGTGLKSGMIQKLNAQLAQRGLHKQLQRILQKKNIPFAGGIAHPTGVRVKTAPIPTGGKLKKLKTGQAMSDRLKFGFSMKRRGAGKVFDPKTKQQSIGGARASRLRGSQAGIRIKHGPRPIGGKLVTTPRGRVTLGPVTLNYTVKKNDTLSHIAQRFYKDGRSWRRIYNANKGVIGKNPHLILPGQKLRIPHR